MHFVVWLDEVLDDLTNMWLASDSATRRRITEATHAVEEQLRYDPLALSESREGSLRITFVAPLSVTYQIEPDGRTVTILHVRKYRTRTG